MKFRILIPAILFCAVLSYAQENYGLWSRYRTITVNTTAAGGGANVAGTVNNFPVLVRLTSAQADVFNLALANGADIRFTLTNGTTRLPHQRERYNAGGMQAEFWVLVPAVAGNASTSIRMYWGMAGVTDSSNGAQVFDTANGFRSVWHLGDATGSNPRPNATVFSGLTARPRNFTTPPAPVQGVIALADSFSGGTAPNDGPGTGYWMEIDSGTGIAPAAYRFPNGMFTYTLWAKHDRRNGNSRFFQILGADNQGTSPKHAIQAIPGGGTGAAAGSVYFRFRTGATGTAYSGNNSGGGLDLGATVTNQVVLNVGAWHHLAGVIARGPDNDTLIKYVDGVAYGKVLSTAANTRLGDTIRNFAFLGRPFENNADSSYAGVMDAIALANARRSDDWIRLAYQTQVSGQTAVTISSTTVVGILGGKPSLEGFAIRRAGASMLFTMPEGAGDMRISVSDFQGRTVWSRAVTAGAREISWDGKTQGRKASAGLYLVRLTSADASRDNAEIAVRKFTLAP